MAKVKKTNIKCWQDVEQWNFHTLLIEIQNGSVTLVNHMVVSYKVKYTITILLSNSNPRYLSQRNENICPQTYM